MYKKLKKIQFYKQYPEYIPFIGANFAKHKILLLGESHFFNNESWANKIPAEWYINNHNSLNEKEKLRINTRHVVNNFTKTKSRREMFGKIDKVLIELEGYQGIQDIAFMNAFQRPAVGDGKSIKVSKIDIEQSAKVINQVIKIIEPKHICFVSKKSYKKLFRELNFSKIDVVVHPSSAWWYRKKGVYGKKAFSELLEKYI